MPVTNTEKATISLDGLTATATVDGTASQPWHPHGTAYRYAVTVTDGETTYEFPAWGSIADHDTETTQPHDIAAMVLGELLSAAYDPNEFWTMALGYEPEGTAPDRERVHDVERVLDAAAAMYAALDRNSEAISELDQ